MTKTIYFLRGHYSGAMVLAEIAKEIERKKDIAKMYRELPAALENIKNMESEK